MKKKQKSNGKTTIYDIARSTGASPSTVSAALSGTWRSRRIKESTALEIQRLAEEQGYTTNMQARGLRKARSGLVGMVLPAHFNRFYAAMSQIFEAHVRTRGMCPVVVSTLREPEEVLGDVQRRSKHQLRVRSGGLDAFGHILYHTALFLALLLASNALRFFRIPFFASAWAYSFPLAALSIATLRMAELGGSPFFGVLGGALLVLTSGVIALLAARTVKAIAAGEICKPE